MSRTRKSAKAAGARFERQIADFLRAGIVIAKRRGTTRHDDGWLLAGNSCIWQSVRAIRPEGPFRVLREGWGE